MNLFKKILSIGKSIFSSAKGDVKRSNKKKSKKKNFSDKKKSAKFSKNASHIKAQKNSSFKKDKSTRAKVPNHREADIKKSEKQRIQRKTSLPTILSSEELESVADFSQLGLSPAVCSAVKDMGYASPTPIQSKTIPAILTGVDVIGTAQTGTGKTAAFSLPIVNMLSDSQQAPRVLVLSPTRELASQTADAFKNFSKYTPIETLLIQGGVSIERQIDALEAGVDVVVATPGRLLDLIRNRAISLKNIQFLVLDEVDRMFDMGFIEDVSTIIKRCPKNRQTLFFSATMPDEVMRLSKWALNNPERLDTGIVHSPADTIEHYIYPVDAIQKYDLLIEFLKSIEFDSLIVFTRTRMDSDRVGEWLIAHNYKVSILHSDRSQRERDKALDDFKNRKTNILVATDIASRGLDINDVQYVINYNVPEHAEDYVHRIGRTGRANKDGIALTFFSSDETIALKRIEDFINAKIERRKLDGFEYRNEPVLTEEIKKPRKRNR